MPRSDWNILAPVAGLAALFVAFSLGSYVTALDNPQQGYPRYSDAREQAVRADAAAPVDVAQAAQYRRPCANPQRESESDLCAQWRAANAAEDSALWTRLGFWAGLFALVGLWWQVVLTRRAVEDTSEATEAMRDANKLARSLGEAQVRGYVTITKLDLTWTPEGIGDAVCEISNTGQTPVFDIRWSVAFHVTRSTPNRTSREYFGNLTGSYETIGPNRDHRFAPTLIDFAFTAEETQTIKEGDTGLGIIANVWIKGSDVFDGPVWEQQNFLAVFKAENITRGGDMVKIGFARARNEKRPANDDNSPRTGG